MVFKKGTIPWNKGLTKETDSRIKGAIHTDESKRKISEAKIEYFSDPCNKELLRQKTKESWIDAKIRNDRLVNGLATRSTPEYKEKISRILREVHARPDVRESDINNVNRIAIDPVVNHKRSTSLKRYYQEHPDAHLGPNNPRFIQDRERRYHYTCNETLIQRIREKFNNSCFICKYVPDLKEDKISIHHIDYNSKQEITERNNWRLIALCSHHHGKTNYNRWYWFNLLINY